MYVSVLTSDLPYHTAYAMLCSVSTQLLLSSVFSMACAALLVLASPSASLTARTAAFVVPIVALVYFV